VVARMRLKLRVNGAEREAEAREHESLLTVLRERLGLWGSKNACEQGECGSCSVLIDGDLVCSCLVLAGAAEDRDVRTVEDLAEGEHMHPVQRAFVDAGAVQCGFCTPGLIVATAALLRDNPEPSDAEIREALSGNICRCTGYGKILEAVRRSASRGYAP
jgi:carbon-monoxide dehydrogenase small subunit